MPGIFDSFEQYERTRDAYHRDLMQVVRLRAELGSGRLNDEEIERRIAPLQQRMTAMEALVTAHEAGMLAAAGHPKDKDEGSA